MDNGTLGNFKKQRVKIDGRWVYINTDWKAFIFGKTNGHCIYCNKKLNFKRQGNRNMLAFTVDHFFPRRLGRHRSYYSNLVPCCVLCNHRKAGSLPIKFLGKNKFKRLHQELFGENEEKMFIKY